MREAVWLRLRRSRLLRRLYEVPFVAKPMKSLSHLLVPSQATRKLRVRSGAAQGLIFELNPRWETHLWEGLHEVEDQAFLAERIKPGHIFYDVGAGFGFYSVLAARLGAHVFAFEPDTQNAESVRRHAKINSLESSIELVQEVVSSKSGVAQLEPAEQQRGHGNGHVRRSDAKALGQTQAVKCTSLDDFSMNLPPPDVLKVDVEGYETEVFKGAEDLFGRCRPYVLCEVHDPENASFVESWLRERNFSVNWVESVDGYPRHIIARP